MHIDELTPGDCDELNRRVRRERDADQRDRYRVVVLAIEGWQTLAIMTTVARSRGFVQRWAYAYRDGGIDAIVEQARGGSKPRLDAAKQAQFIARFKAGPTEADGGLCTLRGKDAVRILAAEYGQAYSLNGAYKLLHRNGLSCLKPRPCHRKNDAQAMTQWLEEAPFLSSVCVTNTPRSKSRSGSRTKPGSASRAR